jgi:hypothetical protein
MREESLIEALQDISDIKYAVESIAYVENNIDWEQRRYEIAKSAMNAMLANPELLQVVTSKEYVVGTFCQNRVAKVSVDYADALIAELKKKGE